MMDLEKLEREYGQKLPGLEALREEALHTLQGRLKGSRAQLHSVVSRVKDPQSFVDRVQRKASEDIAQEVDPEGISDTVGLRVVCLFLSDVYAVRDIVDQCFDIVKEDNKIEPADPAAFGYMGIHLICKMKSEYKGPRYDELPPVPFEVQVRTIGMDAWASISHHIDYKSTEAVPSDLRRDFYALSGMLYVADKHFEMFIERRRQSQKRIEEVGEAELAAQEINLDTLTTYLRRKLPDRSTSGDRVVSGFADVLTKLGYKSIAEIDDLFSRAYDRVLAWESEYGGRRRDTSVIHAMLVMTNQEYGAEYLSRVLTPSARGLSKYCIPPRVKKK